MAAQTDGPAPAERPGPRILIVGCGGVGGVIAAHLAGRGADVTALSRNPAIVGAVRAGGLRLRGHDGALTARPAIHLAPPAGARFDLVLLATQPPDVERAAASALEHLAPDGRLVCLQNGLCEERVAAVVGDRARVLGGIVAWGASMVEPGLCDRTSGGGFTLGALDGADDPALRQLVTLLAPIGPVRVTGNLLGARWSKLALNCATSSLSALTGQTLGWLVARRSARRLTLELMSEAVTVARGLAVRLEKIAGTLDPGWIALSDAQRQQRLGSPSLVAKHALLGVVGLRYRRLRSSMLLALQRGRPPAVDFLNGEIVSRGARLGIPTPANAAISARIWRIARGELAPGPQRLGELLAETRAASARDAARRRGWALR